MISRRLGFSTIQSTRLAATPWGSTDGDTEIAGQTLCRRRGESQPRKDGRDPGALEKAKIDRLGARHAGGIEAERRPEQCGVHAGEHGDVARWNTIVDEGLHGIAGEGGGIRPGNEIECAILGLAFGERMDRLGDAVSVVAEQGERCRRPGRDR